MKRALTVSFKIRNVGINGKEFLYKILLLLLLVHSRCCKLVMSSRSKTPGVIAACSL